MSDQSIQEFLDQIVRKFMELDGHEHANRDNEAEQARSDIHYLAEQLCVVRYAEIQSALADQRRYQAIFDSKPVQEGGAHFIIKGKYGLSSSKVKEEMDAYLDNLLDPRPCKGEV